MNSPFVQTTHEMIKDLVEYSERRSWHATLMDIRRLEEVPEPVC